MKKTTEQFTPYDPAEDLDSDEAIAIFMAEAFKTEDVAYISHAVGVVARAKGMTQIAEDAGVSRKELYRSLNDLGDTTSTTNILVKRAFGLEPEAKLSKAA